MRRWRLPRAFFAVSWLNAFDSPGGWFNVDVVATSTPEARVLDGMKGPQSLSSWMST